MSDQSELPVEYQKATLIFIGRQKSREHKQYWMWIKIDLVQNDGSPLNYETAAEVFFAGKNLMTGIQPGVIIEMDTKPGEGNATSFIVSSGKIVGHWQNRDDVQKWAFAHRLVEREIDQAGDAVKKVKDAIPMENLRPFKEAYKNCTNAAQRAQLIAMIIEEVTNKRF